jgi:hypothetical protein
MVVTSFGREVERAENKDGVVETIDRRYYLAAAPNLIQLTHENNTTPSLHHPSTDIFTTVALIANPSP